MTALSKWISGQWFKIFLLSLARVVLLPYEFIIELCLGGDLHLLDGLQLASSVLCVIMNLGCSVVFELYPALMLGAQLNSKFLKIYPWYSYLVFTRVGEERLLRCSVVDWRILVLWQYLNSVVLLVAILTFLLWVLLEEAVHLTGYSLFDFLVVLIGISMVVAEVVLSVLANAHELLLFSVAQSQRLGLFTFRLVP